MAGWFRVQSPPDTVYGAQYTLRADFADQVRLLAFDLGACAQRVPFSCPRQVPDPPRTGMSSLPQIRARAGGSLPVVLYWRALVPLTTDYRVFVHLDAPDGQTYANADELNPEDIPTSHWPPSLYLRNPLTLELPHDAPPIRYTLTAGLYDPKTMVRPPVTACQGCPAAGDVGHALPLAHVWLLPAKPVDERDIPHRLDYRLGDDITLLGYDLTGTAPTTLTLYWRAEAGVGAAYTVFIHALDAEGEIVAQFDTPPLDGLYPTDAWLPSQIIADAHAIASPEAARTLAIGLYDPNTLARLPVTDGEGRGVPEDAVRVQVMGNE
jgi:hypothetical protein